MEKKQGLDGWSVGLHGRNRKYFHYMKDGQWICGTTKVARPTESSFNLGLATLHEEIDASAKCKKCLKIISGGTF